VRLRLLFFAVLRERFGDSSAEREVHGPTTVSELWSRLREESPQLAEYGGRVAFAVNQEYVDGKRTLQDNDEVAFIPPVSGGIPSRRRGYV
jgi:molybdopterin converting factor subunit 1